MTGAQLEDELPKSSMVGRVAPMQLSLAGTMQSKPTHTPALSLSKRERVNHSAPLEPSRNGDFIERGRKYLPLPGGEGRGEGGRSFQLHRFGLGAVLEFTSMTTSPVHLKFSPTSCNFRRDLLMNEV